MITNESIYSITSKITTTIRSFSLDFPSSKIAELSDASRPTINKLLLKLRIRVAQVCDASSPFSGEVEVDESYFARRVRGKKGRGAGGKPIVFGILERQGKVYTEIAPDSSKKQRQAAIRGQAALEASSARTAGEAIMGWWTWGTKSISECIMARINLPVVIAISMALNHFGHMLNEDFQGSMVFPDKHFIYTPRNVSLDLIAERKISL